MHLRTNHIYTDKADSAEQARQTAVVNPQVDLRQSWMATRPGDKCIFHGGHVRARREQTSRKKIDAHKYGFPCLAGK